MCACESDVHPSLIRGNQLLPGLKIYTDFKTLIFLIGIYGR